MHVYTVIGAGGTHLHVEETGQRNGQPILFLHSFSHSRFVWHKQLCSALQNDWRLVAMDLRGHGASQKPPNVYQAPSLWANDIHAVITTLDLDQVILCAWSYGAVVACDYLRTYGAAHIAGLHLVSTLLRTDIADAASFVGAEFLALGPGLFSTDAVESIAALQAFLRLCFHREPPPTDLAFLLGSSVQTPPYVRQSLLSRTWSCHDILRGWSKPLLITHGCEDAIVLSAATKDMAPMIPQAHISLYPGIGHMPFWENARRFNDELRAFAMATTA